MISRKNNRVKTCAIYGVAAALAALGEITLGSVALAQPPPATAVSSGAPLQLDEVLTTVQAAYPKLIGADAERRAAIAKRRAKQGAFDPVSFSNVDYIEYNSTSTRGKAANMTARTAGVEMTLRNGMKLMAGTNLNFGTVKSPLSSTGSNGEYFAGFKLPLLRGWNVNEKSVAERQAILGIPLAEQNVAATRLGALLGAAVSYWDWVAAGQKLTVARDLLAIARERARQIKTRADRGDLPPIDAVEAEQEVQRREGAYTKAERDLQKAAFKLAAYLWQGDGTPAAVPPAERVPGAMPTPSPLDEAAVAEARRRAEAERPEVRAVGVARQIVQADLNLALNDQKPNVDLVFIPGADTGARAIGETLKAGVAFSLPLNRWDATGRRDEARAKLQKLEQEQALVTRQVGLEVDDAASAVNTAEARFRAAQREVELAVQMEEGERKRFALGDSTLFLVNQRERATAEARSKLIEVQAEYQQAIAAFRAASAQL